MRSLLRALPVLVLLIAAVECVLVRLDLAYRPTETRLFLQTVPLWAAFGLLALVPAWLTVRVLRRLDPWPPAVLASWMLLPVLAHGVLDRYTGLAGSLAGLATVRPWVELALAIVALVVLAFLVARGGRRLPRLFHVALAAVAVVVGLFVPLRGVPTSNDTAAAGKPNLLLLVWDTCRSDKLGPYGHGRETSPFLEELAGESIVFEDSLSVAVFTFSSHLSMLTGVYPSTHGGRLLSMRYDPRRATTLAALLREAGYRTGGFVGTDVLAGRTGVRYGFERYDDQVDPPVCDTRAWKLVHDLQTVAAARIPALRNNGQPHWFQDFQRPAEEVLANALEWIRRDDPRPWFCFVNLYDVHWPYLPDEEAARLLVDTEPGALDGYLFRADHWQKGAPIADDDRDHVVQLYEAEIRELDETVADFLAALELDRGGTAVLVTSDHGEAFGERDEWKHEDIGEVQIRVPFLLRPPEPEPRPERRPGPVSGVDVTPTLLGLAGVPAPGGLEGVDLLAAPDPDRVLFVEDRDHSTPENVQVAIYRPPYKLVRLGMGEDARYALHDLRTDPLGEVDVQVREPEVFRALKALLDARRAAFDEAEAGIRTDGAHSQLDALQALGYTEN